MTRRSRFAGLFLLLFGLMLLFADLDTPRIHMLHGVDIVALTGCGACLGLGIFGLIGLLRLGKE